MDEIEKKEQIRLLKAFALRRFDGCPFGPGDIVKQVEGSDRYKIPGPGEVAIVVAVDNTIGQPQGEGNTASGNMAIAVITKDDIESPCIQIYWVDSEVFVKAN
jgi:hypothetical protein